MTLDAGTAARHTALAGILALVLFAVGVGSLVQETGCTQTAHYALVRALADGTPIIDPYHEETCDKAYTDGHYYAAKAPGLAFFTLPPYLALDAAGLVPENDRTAIWLLGLWAALLPALVLGLVAARLAQRVEPRVAIPAATAVIAGTLVLPFATLLFSHVLAALCLAAAFAVLWRARVGVRAALVAGALAGFAAVFDHPAALPAAIVAFYALARGGVRAFGAYAAGGVAGVLPLLAYNVWSFGSPTHFAVDDAVIVAGDTGHDVVGAVDRGFFGAVLPSTYVALELLASAKGLLTLSPVLAAGVVGTFLLLRRGLRAEALLILAVVGITFLWNSGLTGPFGGPFGGDSPGARYLVSVLPFLAPGIAVALRRAFLPTALLTAVSIFFLALATATEPMLDGFATSRWWELAAAGDFTRTVVTLLDGPEGLLAVLPFVAGVSAAAGIAFAAVPTRLPALPTLAAAGGVLGAWALVASAAPPLLERGRTLAALAVVVLGAAGAYVALRGPADARADARRLAGAATASQWRPLLLGALLAAAVLVVWHGATSIAPSDGYDGDAHVEYAEHLQRTGALPEEEDTYEFASPPLFQWLSVQGQNLAGRVAAGANAMSDGPSGPAGRVLWLGLLLAGVWLAVSPRRRLGIGLLAGVSVLLGLEVALAAVGTEWRVGQVISAAATAGILVLAWLLGREVWPGETRRPLAVAVAAAGIPLLFRLGSMFHPEALFALLSVAALVLVVRSYRLGWPPGHAVAVGAVLGAAALTRQTAVIVVVSLGLAVLLAGRLRAVRFVAVTAAVLLVVAGPWWLLQYDRYGNPIQSNLEREGYLLAEGQPASFFVSFPVVDVVTHPYRPAFQNELLPMIHADIWSDWFGGHHQYWADPTPAERFFVSTQSVLGLPASILGVVALFAFGVPALRRLVRQTADGRDFVFAASFLLAVLSWVAFVTTLVRFPQAEGDPVKASYMLFLVPVFALVLVRVGACLWRRGGAVRIAVAAWCVLYAVSYAGYLLTAW